MWWVWSSAGLGFTPPILASVSGLCVRVQVFLSTCQSWLGCPGVRVCVRALPVPRHSWLGALVRLFRYGFLASSHLSRLGFVVCASGNGLRFHPAKPGWSVRVCVCAHALHLYPAKPGRRLGRVALGAGFGLYPANFGWGLGCGCVCLFAPSACTPQIQAGVCGACVWVRGFGFILLIWAAVWDVGVCVWVRNWASPG